MLHLKFSFRLVTQKSKATAFFNVNPHNFLFFFFFIGVNNYSFQILPGFASIRHPAASELIVISNGGEEAQSGLLAADQMDNL